MVYGHPAIVLPLEPIRVLVEVGLASGGDRIDCTYFQGKLEEAPERLSGLAAVVEEARRELESSLSGFSLTIRSEIPPGYGLGSSAAVAVALVRALYDVHRHPLTQEQLLHLVHIAETHAHGTPSGVDAWAASTDYPLWFVRGRRPESLPLMRPLFLVVANSRVPGNTREAVQHVRESLERLQGGESPVDRLAALASRARTALSRGDYAELGRLMTGAHEQLAELGIATDHLNALVGAALEQGALGAKLTGSGEGGSMIALAPDKNRQNQVAATLAQAGALQVWTPVLGENSIG